MNRDDDVDDGDRHVGDMQGALMSEVACSSAKKIGDVSLTKKTCKRKVCR